MLGFDGDRLRCTGGIARPPAIIRAAPARRTNCAPMPDKALKHHPRRDQAQPARQLRRTLMRRQDHRPRASTPSPICPAKLGGLGQGAAAWAWTSTPPTSRIPMVKDGLHPGQPGRGGAPTSGSSTASAAARSAEAFAKALGKACVINYWMPDGLQGRPRRHAPALAARMESRWTRSSPTKSTIPRAGAGTVSPSCSAWAWRATPWAATELMHGLRRYTPGQCYYCLDAGHFHPTEVISDKTLAPCCDMPDCISARHPRRALGQPTT